MASYRLAIRRDTAANWTSADPVLAQGEFGWEYDTSLLKIGDGTTAWSALGYYDPNPALGTGGSLVGAFKYNNTAGAPGDGRFGFDNTTPISVTLLNISTVSLNDFEWTGLANRILPVGSQFVAIQKNDSTKWIHVQIDSGPTNNTTYYTYDVSFVDEGPGGMPTSTKECVIEIIQPVRAILDDLDDVIIGTPANTEVLQYNGTEWVNAAAPATYTDADVDTHLNTSTATTNDVLQWSGTDYTWAAVSGGASTLVDLTDTTITTPSTGQVLEYNGTAWVNATPSGGGASALTDLSDVTITTPATDQILQYNGTEWANATATYLKDESTGTNGLAIGTSTTNANINTVAIGHLTECGPNSVAIGYDAGGSGSYTVAIGYQAKDFNTGNFSVAIGREALETGSGGEQVAVGYRAGSQNPSLGSVSLGYQAGYSGMGSYAIGIGYGASYSGTGARSIVLNASGSTYSSAATDEITLINGEQTVTFDNATGMSYTNDKLSTPQTMRMDPNGGVYIFPNLPTADPVNAGQLWNDAGTLKVSAG